MLLRKRSIAIAVGLALSAAAIQPSPVINVNGGKAWQENLADGQEMTRLSVTDEESKTRKEYAVTVGDGTGTLKFGQTASGNKSLVAVWGEQNEYVPSYEIGMNVHGGMHFDGVALTGYKTRFIDIGESKSTARLGFFTMSGPLVIENSTTESSAISVNAQATFGDITLRKVTGDDSLIKLEHHNSSMSGKFVAGNILFDHVTMTYDGEAGMTSTTGSSLAVGDFTVVSSDFSAGRVLDLHSQNFTMGNVTVTGTVDDPTRFKETVIEIQAGASSAIGDITVDHVTGAGADDTESAIVYLNSLNRDLKVGAIRVSDAEFTAPNATLANTSGIYLQKVSGFSSADVARLEHTGTDGLVSLYGISMRSVTAADPIDHLTVSTVTAHANTEESEVAGIRLHNVDMTAGVKTVAVENIVAKGAAFATGLDVAYGGLKITDSVSVRRVSSAGNSAYGARFDGAYDDDLPCADIASFTIDGVTSSERAAHGILSADNTLNIESLSISNVSGKTISSALTAREAGRINVQNASIRAAASGAGNELRTMAVYADGGTVNISAGEIEGAIVSDNAAAVTLGDGVRSVKSDVHVMNGSSFKAGIGTGSVLTGQVDDYWNGKSVRPVSIVDSYGRTWSPPQLRAPHDWIFRAAPGTPRAGTSFPNSPSAPTAVRST